MRISIILAAVAVSAGYELFVYEQSRIDILKSINAKYQAQIKSDQDMLAKGTDAMKRADKAMESQGQSIENQDKAIDKLEQALRRMTAVAQEQDQQLKHDSAVMDACSVALRVAK